MRHLLMTFDRARKHACKREENLEVRDRKCWSAAAQGDYQDLLLPPSERRLATSVPMMKRS